MEAYNVLLTERKKYNFVDSFNVKEKKEKEKNINKSFLIF